jgi:glycosyltransferase involved in cell wall biosynthesis
MSREHPHVAAPYVVLVSPVHNEAEHFEQTAEGVLAQTRRPDLWIVVNDNSTDGTAEVLERVRPGVPFMRVVETPPNFTVDSGDRNAAGGPDRAFNFGLAQIDVPYTHVGKLDGDIVLPPNYLEETLSRFASDPTLGIMGGAVYEPDEGGEWRLMATPADQATPQARIFSRGCFEAIGGFPPQHGADVITVVYAKMRGYTTRTYADLPIRHLRPMATADGVRRGRKRQGEYQWIVHYGLGWVLLRSILVAFRFRPRGWSGLWFLWGYLEAALKRVPRVPDPEFRRFTKAEQRRRYRAAAARLLRVRSEAAAAGTHVSRVESL